MTEREIKVSRDYLYGYYLGFHSYIIDSSYVSTPALKIGVLDGEADRYYNNVEFSFVRGDAMHWARLEQDGLLLGAVRIGYTSPFLSIYFQILSKDDPVPTDKYFWDSIEHWQYFT